MHHSSRISSRKHSEISVRFYFISVSTEVKRDGHPLKVNYFAFVLHKFMMHFPYPIIAECDLRR